MRLSALLTAVVVLAAVAGALPSVPAAGPSSAAATAGDSPAVAGDSPPVIGPSTAPPISSTGPPDGAQPASSVAGLDEPPETEIRILLRTDRNATWNVTITYRLESEREVEAFDDLAEDFEGGTADGPIDAGTFERFVALADNSTTRGMSMADVRRHAARNGTTGRLRLEFTWVNFLASEDDRLVLDDAFTTADGEPWLGSLDHHQRLVIETPSGYQVNTTPGVNPDIRDGNAWIEGPQRFTVEERVVITYSPVRGTDPSPVSPTPTPTAPDESDWELLGGAFLIGAVILAAALLYRRRTPAGGAEPADAAVPTVDSRDGAPGDSAASSAEESTSGDAGAEESEDLSLLSDEERVERLIERNGGRMRQAAIVEETGWSDAKVSQLLSSMAEAERVEKLRLGRENLISLPDEDEGDDGNAGE
ncbi:MAG: hypothetical protein V5A46_00135 [Haloferacaceae archaeon]